MKTSENFNELSGALAKAAALFPKIERGRTATVFPKDEKKRSYSYDYADLDDVLSAVRGPLAANGLTLSHDCKVTLEPLRVEVTARLDHASGQWRESEPLPIPCEGQMSAAQQIGSACTYGKRYTSQNILGISTDSDDDGNAAANHDSETNKREPLPDCPACKTNKSVIVGKPEYGGGFVCFTRKGGCGAKWQSGEEERPMRGKDENPEPESKPGKANGKKSKAAEVAEQHGMMTAEQLASFDQWGGLLLKCRPETHQASINTLKKAIGDGRLSADFIVKILTRCLDRVETPEQLKSVEDAIQPLCEAANVAHRDVMKFGELVPLVEDRLSVGAKS